LEWSVLRRAVVLDLARTIGEYTTKVLAKQKQRDKSKTTIATTKRTAAIDSGRRIDPGASVPALVRRQEEGMHTNPGN
jgi:hypothetical protein